MADYTISLLARRVRHGGHRHNWEGQGSIPVPWHESGSGSVSGSVDHVSAAEQEADLAEQAARLLSLFSDFRYSRADLVVEVAACVAAMPPTHKLPPAVACSLMGEPACLHAYAPDCPHA